MEYKHRWYFSNGAKYKYPIKFISDCCAHIVLNGTPIGPDLEQNGLTTKREEALRDVPRKLTQKIAEVTGKNTFTDYSSGITYTLTDEINVRRFLRDMKVTTQGTDDTVSKFFTDIIPMLVGGQSLDESYFAFNYKKGKDPELFSQNSGADGSGNQDKEGHPDMVKKIISDKIEASVKKCVVFTGAPGMGKTYCVEQYVVPKMEGAFKKGEYFVQFHSSYDYTDFMEGLRPIQEGKNMVFVRMDGIFKAFCRKVVKLNKESGFPEDGAIEEKPEDGAADKKSIPPMYYFVIDEINRADLGRVFGELMYCFEKRGKEHKIATQYANLPAYGKDEEENIVPIKGDIFEKNFYIPHNVVIIGTMNDIDRSVETFDFALRRRFDWVNIDTNTVMDSSLKSMKEEKKITGEITPELVARITAMNKVIADKPGLGSDFAIGPAYFKGYDGTNLKNIWELNIEPILKEYMRGRQDAVTFVKNCKEALFKKDKGGDSLTKPALESGASGSDLQPNNPHTPPAGGQP